MRSSLPVLIKFDNLFKPTSVAKNSFDRRFPNGLSGFNSTLDLQLQITGAVSGGLVQRPIG